MVHSTLLLTGRSEPASPVSAGKRALRRFAALPVLLAVAAAPLAAADRRPAAPALDRRHDHPSRAFAFQTPDGWTVTSPTGRPDALEAWGGALGVRFVYQAGEAGFDALHATCMLERLAAPMDMEPRVAYEYDHLEGFANQRRVLDSAFTVHYDRPVQGHRAWRQRTVTIVGGGQSLCVMTYAPSAVWKKSAQTRALLDAVLSSVTLR